MPQGVSRGEILQNLNLPPSSSYTKHTVDIRSLNPNKEEIKEAVRFVWGIDNNELRRDDLRIIVNDIGFELDGFIRSDKK